MALREVQGGAGLTAGGFIAPSESLDKSRVSCGRGAKCRSTAPPMREIHNAGRHPMPLILPRDSQRAWLEAHSGSAMGLCCRGAVGGVGGLAGVYGGEQSGFR